VSLDDVYAKIEQIVQKDVGNRGIAAITVAGELERAACAFVEARKVVVLTGFPCRMNDSPPTESDGPPGAIALARAALRLGKTVAIATDESSAAVMQQCADAAGLPDLGEFSLHAFPARAEWKPEHEAALKGLIAEFDHAIAIERAGRAVDGSYYTMRALKMDHLVAPIDELLTADCACAISESYYEPPRMFAGAGAPAGGLTQRLEPVAEGDGAEGDAGDAGADGATVSSPRHACVSCACGGAGPAAGAAAGGEAGGVAAAPEAAGAGGACACACHAPQAHRSRRRSSLASQQSRGAGGRRGSAGSASGVIGALGTPLQGRFRVGSTAGDSVAGPEAAEVGSITGESEAGSPRSPDHHQHQQPQLPGDGLRSASASPHPGQELPGEHRRAGPDERPPLHGRPRAVTSPNGMVSGSAPLAGGSGGAAARSGGGGEGGDGLALGWRERSASALQHRMSMASVRSAVPYRGDVWSRAMSWASIPAISRTSTGIGDGGNECGMGKVLESVRAHIPRGETIACVVPCDNLLTAGVSNWGGWGLVAAVEALLRFNQLQALEAEAEAAAAGRAAGSAEGATSGGDGSTRVAPERSPVAAEAVEADEADTGVSAAGAAASATEEPPAEESTTPPTLETPAEDGAVGAPAASASAASSAATSTSKAAAGAAVAGGKKPAPPPPKTPGAGGNRWGAWVGLPASATTAGYTSSRNLMKAQQQAAAAAGGGAEGGAPSPADRLRMRGAGATGGGGAARQKLPAAAAAGGAAPGSSGFRATGSSAGGEAVAADINSFSGDGAAAGSDLGAGSTSGAGGAVAAGRRRASIAEDRNTRLVRAQRPGFLLPSHAEENAVAQAMVASGARDGITGALDGSVDGMPLETHLGVLRALRGVLAEAFAPAFGAVGTLPAAATGAAAYDVDGGDAAGSGVAEGTAAE
jgi:hypothetical protein